MLDACDRRSAVCELYADLIGAFDDVLRCQERSIWTHCEACATGILSKSGNSSV